MNKSQKSCLVVERRIFTQSISVYNFFSFSNYNLEMLIQNFFNLLLI